MRLNDSDNHILTTAVAANAFAQHVEGFPDARCVPQEQFENPLLFLRCSFFQPLLGCFGHGVYYAQLSIANRIDESLHVKGLLNQIIRFVASAVVVSIVGFVYFRWLHVNPATVGFTFLLVILFISAAWGLRYAIFAALLATIAYNYFFLPPLFRFTIADPQNWIALFAFLVTAISASHLSERARRSTSSANQRRREVERLY